MIRNQKCKAEFKLSNNFFIKKVRELKARHTSAEEFLHKTKYTDENIKINTRKLKKKTLQ